MVTKKRKMRLKQSCLIDEIIEHEKTQRIAEIGRRKEYIQLELFEGDDGEKSFNKKRG